MPPSGTHGLPPLTPSVRVCPLALVVRAPVFTGRGALALGVRPGLYHTHGVWCPGHSGAKVHYLPSLTCGTAAQHPPRRKNPGLHGGLLGVPVMQRSHHHQPPAGSRRQRQTLRRVALLLAAATGREAAGFALGGGARPAHTTTPAVPSGWSCGLCPLRWWWHSRHITGTAGQAPGSLWLPASPCAAPCSTRTACAGSGRGSRRPPVAARAGV